MFAALSEMTSDAWHPTSIRERLVRAGFAELNDTSIARPWDVFDHKRNPLLPSALFLAELGEFLTLNDESHRAHMEERPLDERWESLIEGKE